MLSLKQSLIENQSIKLGESAQTWQEAIAVAAAPLIASGAVERDYPTAIIASTEKFGPYYILMPGMAMPHARPEDGVKRDAFSLVVLKNPVVFSDGKEVSVFITLAATSSDIHTGIAIPQIVAVFELPNIIQRLEQASEVNEVLSIIDEADMSAYLNE